MMALDELKPVGNQQSYRLDHDFCVEEIYWPTKNPDDVYYRQCRRTPQKGSDRCWQHQPEKMERSRKAMIERRET